MGISKVTDVTRRRLTNKGVDCTTGSQRCHIAIIESGVLSLSLTGNRIIRHTSQPNLGLGDAMGVESVNDMVTEITKRIAQHHPKKPWGDYTIVSQSGDSITVGCKPDVDNIAEAHLGFGDVMWV
ncbi:hypothetical protein D3C86_1277960 [compost metagenome]